MKETGYRFDYIKLCPFLKFFLFKVIEGFGVCKVIDSTDPNFREGDLVSGITGWEEYSLIRNTDKLRKIATTETPLSYHLGLLGKYLLIVEKIR